MMILMARKIVLYLSAREVDDVDVDNFYDDYIDARDRDDANNDDADDDLDDDRNDGLSIADNNGDDYRIGQNPRQPIHEYGLTLPQLPHRGPRNRDRRMKQDLRRDSQNLDPLVSSKQR